MSKNQRGGLIFIVLLAVASVLCGIVLFALLPNISAGVAMPVITVPGEPFRVDWPFPGFYLTNTMMAVILTAVFLVVIKIMYVNHGEYNEQTIPVSRTYVWVLGITSSGVIILGTVGASPLFDWAIKGADTLLS